MLWLLATLGGLAQVAALGLVQWSFYAIVANLPTRDDLNGLGQMAQATVIYDTNDRFAFTIYQEQRRDVPLQAVSPHLVARLSPSRTSVSTNTAVWISCGSRARSRQSSEGRRAQGGSTLTQQLARQSFLTPDKTSAAKSRKRSSPRASSANTARSRSSSST